MKDERNRLNTGHTKLTHRLCAKNVTVDNEKMVVVRYDDSRIYILGTNHIDNRFAAIVQQLIKRLSPEVVGVELCRTRIGYRHLIAGDDDELRRYRHPAAALLNEFKFQGIPERYRKSAIGEKLTLLYAYGAVKYAESKLFRVQLHKYQQMRTYKLRPPTRVDERTCIGAELATPFRNFVWRCDGLQSKYLSNSCTRYKILLLDRPVQETYALMAAALTGEEKRFIKNYKLNFEREYVAFREQQKSAATIMGSLMVSRNARLRSIFIDQRDEYMAETVFKAVSEDRIRKMLCIMGRNHVGGVLMHLKKMASRRKR